jgi:hypothetical protein
MRKEFSRFYMATYNSSVLHPNTGECELLFNLDLAISFMPMKSMASLGKGGRQRSVPKKEEGRDHDPLEGGGGEHCSVSWARRDTWYSWRA